MPSVEVADFLDKSPRRSGVRSAARRRRRVRPFATAATLTFTATVAVILALGWRARDAELLSAETGAGYALGIVGGLLMLALLLYPLRKRWAYFREYGSLRNWFRLHMMLGVVGPVCILFHANFRFGSTNSNVALVSMLVVVASGIAGRYLYGRVHHGLYGHRLTLEEMRDALAQDRNALTSVITTSPSVLAALAEIDRELAATPRSIPELWRRGRRATHRARALRWVLDREIPAAVARASAEGRVGVIERYRARRSVRVRVRRYARAVRATALFTIYERALSAWHYLHVPLFVLLLFAGIVHVVAVHAY